MPALLLLLLSASAVSPRGAVASAHPLASEAAATVLREGGNAVDAAVAAAFVLAVVEPESSGLGGGGFALVHLAREQRDVALDFREVAPAAARADMFGGARPEGSPGPSLDGGLAVAVPGAVKGYAELARRYGTLPLARLVEPAARIAERGFPVGPHFLGAARARLSCLAARPAAARAFLVRGEGGAWAVPAAGTRLRQPALARTLRRLGKDPDAFYRGALAAAIARAAQEDGGVLAAADLAAFRVRERAPLAGSYRGRRVVSMPLPSSGGAIVIGLLQALERAAPAAPARAATSGAYRTVELLHAMAELEKQLYARRGLLGDPAFVPAAAAEVARLVSPEAAAAMAAAVGPRAAVVEGPPAPPETSQTSHLSVVDGAGNAVALTTTVNYLFGSCVVVPGAGFVLNDEMDDFDSAPGVPNVFGAVGAGQNLPAPGKIPLSSMAPTLVYAPDGRLWLAVGSPGGTTIPTSVAQVITHMVDDGMSLSQAVSTPRLHHQWRPDAIQVEPGGLEAETARALEARGHALLWRLRPWGNPQAVQVTQDGVYEAASDASGQGAPAAP
jgi:gamma-glutamyltranspeptidase/glutathione hydrolase